MAIYIKHKFTIAQMHIFFHLAVQLYNISNVACFFWAFFLLNPPNLRILQTEAFHKCYWITQNLLFFFSVCVCAPISFVFLTYPEGTGAKVDCWQGVSTQQWNCMGAFLGPLLLQDPLLGSPEAAKHTVNMWRPSSSSGTGEALNQQNWPSYSQQQKAKIYGLNTCTPRIPATNTQ